MTMIKGILFKKRRDAQDGVQLVVRQQWNTKSRNEKNGEAQKGDFGGGSKKS